MLSHDKILLDMLFGAFHDTPCNLINFESHFSEGPVKLSLTKQNDFETDLELKIVILDMIRLFFQNFIYRTGGFSVHSITELFIKKAPRSDLVSEPPDQMFISNVFQSYQDIEPGDQLLLTMKGALSTDLETEFQYSRSLVLFK